MHNQASPDDATFPFIQKLCSDLDEQGKKEAEERFLLFLKDTLEVFERMNAQEEKLNSRSL